MCASVDLRKQIRGALGSFMLDSFFGPSLCGFDLGVSDDGASDDDDASYSRIERLAAALVNIPIVCPHEA